ncbi:hypothetical protein IQ247_09750 [Plectonema cf. radiosum LEGE 06105]|uniref:Uncharacterized protein n=1 Tax=Plectonema cf. radiosum LEGE 06105 TaxID=945769 RepID=A0A8J7JU29_9CYAN|nr:hypothetical protein [Plectonema radiosum]MBE9212965.1 hypothetical protein [Plectonema cf. radiosum LEGE 06105]
MKNNKDRLSHLSNAYWHLDLITNTNSPEIRAIKAQIETLINKENK